MPNDSLATTSTLVNHLKLKASLYPSAQSYPKLPAFFECVCLLSIKMFVQNPCRDVLSLFK